MEELPPELLFAICETLPFTSLYHLLFVSRPLSAVVSAFLTERLLRLPLWLWVTRWKSILTLGHYEESLAELAEHNAPGLLYRLPFTPDILAALRQTGRKDIFRCRLQGIVVQLNGTSVPISFPTAFLFSVSSRITIALPVEVVFAIRPNSFTFLNTLPPLQSPALRSPLPLAAASATPVLGGREGFALSTTVTLYNGINEEELHYNLGAVLAWNEPAWQEIPGDSLVYLPQLRRARRRGEIRRKPRSYCTGEGLKSLSGNVVKRWCDQKKEQEAWGRIVFVSFEQTEDDIELLRELQALMGL